MNKMHFSPINEDLVSVVMCTYNGEQFIEEQLLSIRSQTWLNLEILIADDASTDNTWSILQKHANADSRIQLFRNSKNIGYINNFSQNCARATGKFIAISDQDDIWLSEKIEQLLINIGDHSPMIYCDSQRFKDVQPKSATPRSNYRRFEGTKLLRIALFNTISGHALLARTEFVRQILPFPSNLFYDWYMAAVACTCGGVQYLPKTLVFQRVHDKNISVGIGFHRTENSSNRKYMLLVLEHSKAFSQIPALLSGTRSLIEKWVEVLEEALYRRSFWNCFIFIMRHRVSLFWYKKKPITFFSHVKHAFLISRCH